MKYWFDPEAECEYFDAIRYYENETAGLGIRFIEDFEKTLARILSFPEAWSPLTRNTRRALFEIFPYGIIYHFDEMNVYILAVMHLKRKPEYWIKRLEQFMEWKIE
jgi:hypothetical protein